MVGRFEHSFCRILSRQLSPLFAPFPRSTTSLRPSLRSRSIVYRKVRNMLTAAPLPSTLFLVRSVSRAGSGPVRIDCSTCASSKLLLTAQRQLELRPFSGAYLRPAFIENIVISMFLYRVSVKTIFSSRSAVGIF